MKHSIHLKMNALTKIKLLILLIVSTSSFAQSIQLGTDATVCPGPISIENSVPVQSNFLVLDDPTYVNLFDDQYSSLVPIGFPFAFYGSSYDSLVIGSNIILSFNEALSDGYCPWSISAPLPSSTYSFSAIFASYMDVNPSLGGTISYQTIGTAPNRRFIVLYSDLVMYNCFLPCWSAAIILYETSNIIEIHLKDKPICTSWNSGYSIQGLQNQSATIAHVVPGNQPPNVWSTGLDGKQFTPNGPNDYIITNTPFIPILTGNANLVWANTEGATFAYTPIIQTNVEFEDSLAYFIAVSSPDICNGYSFSLSDSSWIDVPSQGYELEVINDFCGLNNGVINSMTNTTDLSFFWSDLNISADTLTGLSSGTYPFVYTSTLGCTVNDTIIIESDTLYITETTHPTCQSNADGSISILPSSLSISYSWIQPPGLTSSFIDGLPEGDYTCIVSVGQNCIDTLNFSLFSPSQINVINESVENVTCFGTDDGEYGYGYTSTFMPATCTWDGTTIVPQYLFFLSSGWHELSITNSIGCQIVHDVYIDGPAEEFTVSASVTPSSNGANGTVTFTETGGSGTIVNYELNGTNQSTPTFTNLIPGNYTAYIKDSWGCEIPVSFIIDDISGLAENENGTITFGPNPTEGIIVVNSLNSSFKLTISDTKGSVLYQSNWNTNLSIDLSDLSNGSYFLVFFFEDNSMLTKNLQLLK